MNFAKLLPQDFLDYEWNDIEYTECSFSTYKFEIIRYCLVEGKKVISFIEMVRSLTWYGYEELDRLALTAIATKESYKNHGLAKMVVDFTFKDLYNERSIILSTFTDDGSKYIEPHIREVMKKHGIMEAY